ncbi:uncharacterized protein F5Z01DRAFT_672954 [Emericellopsis atlantica]|uniref:Uncharacterized protein n=1 Tax=Emericellopsis atlantica TaxID=2614577 RepID=A0A9P7ZQ48_9HYPO|nr:uncharacterized protein F5Z01DRAFT_672954 [Emericellopsis atlantica]KAG9255650.1 hypothetical protein F5Z01DRAFT_672954 [Emericellopsis atlantica]
MPPKRKHAKLQRSSSPTRLPPGNGVGFRARLRSIVHSEASPASDSACDVTTLPLTVEQQFRMHLLWDSCSPSTKEDVSDKAADKDADQIAALMDAFTRAGSALHATAFARLAQHRESFDKQVAGLTEDSNRALEDNERLYAGNIAVPFKFTLFESQNFPSDIVLAHLSSLAHEVHQAEKDVRKLAAEWDECIKAEENIWRELGNDGNERSCHARPDESLSPAEKDAYEKEAKAIVESGCQKIDDLETECKNRCQALLQQAFQKSLMEMD